MTTDLVLPAPSAPGLVQTHDRSLVLQLRSSWNVRCTTSWKSENGKQVLTRLEVNLDLPAHAYVGALQYLADDNASRASPTQLAKALSVLVAVCAKPADFDDAKVVVWSERLKQVLGEYPADVALACISEWPRSANGKWWPTENEVHEDCRERLKFRESLKYALQQAAELKGPLPEPEPDDGLCSEPLGQTAEFVERLKARDAQRAEIYLRGARFGGDVIGVHTKAAKYALLRASQEGDFGRYVRIVLPARVNQDGSVAEWEIG